jgi:hypothetical protein
MCRSPVNLTAAFLSPAGEIEICSIDVDLSCRVPRWIIVEPSNGEFHVYSSSFWAVCICN